MRSDPILRVSPSVTDATPEIPVPAAPAATRTRQRMATARTIEQNLWTGTAPQPVAHIAEGSAPLGRPSRGKLRALVARRAWTVPGRTTSMPPPTAAGNGTGTPPVQAQSPKPAAGRRGHQHKQTGIQRRLRRSRSQHSTQNTRRENWKHRATEGPRPPQRLSTSRKRRTSRPAVTEHVGDESPFALYRPEGPYKAGRTAAKCVWTGRAQPISSAASTRRAGNEMDCRGSASDGHRTEGHAPRRHNARRDCCALTTALTEAVWWWTRLGRLRRRIRGAGALLRKAESAACAAVSGKTAPCRKKHAGTVACAGFAAPRSRLPRRRLALDNCCYRASNR